MRIVKLQMQTTIDGYVAGPEGQLDWMAGAWDEPLLRFVNKLTDSSDTILMGRKMTEGFITYWENVVNNQPDSPEFAFAQKMVNLKKIVFSKTQKTIAGKNIAVETGDLVATVNALKNRPGKDLIVYGGAGFVSSLLDNNLIDELNLFINPVAIGEGLSIFKTRKPLQLANSTAYKNGIVVNKYIPVKAKKTDTKNI
jgi:dihydrofolate reductase